MEEIMKYCRKHKVQSLTGFVGGGGLIWLIIKNCKKEDFFSASFIDILTIGIAIFISFMITEYSDNKRRRNECIEHIILEIEDMVSGDEIVNGESNMTLLKQSSCANRIKYLKDAKFTDIEQDIIFIEEQFQEIRDLYSNHKDDLPSVKNDLERHQRLICDKCNKIRVNLYS